ncbi:MAG: cation diffusion facilitator CzcD-associated flavoprotein CzcO [Candidatus Poriferisodalaceae bacterium]|jgi:cation diffusion facilitator CzcD-associated flavoprotein CzcO
MSGSDSKVDVEVVVVGAGFAGMYLLHRLRNEGFSAIVFEAGSGVGGTWYWNRYPGARCDVRSIDYSYSWDPELEQEWEWSEKFATQPELLRYANHVADRHDLRRDMQFNTKVESARWDEVTRRWLISTGHGKTVSCRHYVMATGCLSVPKPSELDGLDDFAGDVYFSGRWPHHEVDFTGLRVAVVGTGSSAIQSIPIIAAQASSLTIFQRTPNFSMPAFNGPNDPVEVAEVKRNYSDYRHEQRYSAGGVVRGLPTKSAMQDSEDDRRAHFEQGWKSGSLGGVVTAYNDIRVDQGASDLAAAFVHSKIRSIVNDQAIAEKLCPTNHPIGTKRPCLDTNYYQTFNEDHVSLVDLLETPIVGVTESGIETSTGSFEFDAIVMATGFDAMTGAVVAVDIRGVGGAELKQAWADGPRTYLGLCVSGFPNLFLITGPGSPSVLSNMMVSIEQHVEFIADCIVHLRDTAHTTIEADTGAEADWVQHVVEVGDTTLYPKANSWYMGANVPGKPRVFLPYVGGVGAYRLICEDVVADSYRGFVLHA